MKKTILIHILAILQISPILHELFHVLTATLVGWKVTGVVISVSSFSFVQFAALEEMPSVLTRILVYGSGGIGNGVIGLLLLWYAKGKPIFSVKPKAVLIFTTIFSFIYGVWEVIALGIIGFWILGLRL